MAAAAVVAAWRPRRVLVEGRSMAPTLLPGERLLVLRARRIRPDDLVLVADPRRRSRLLVKRVRSEDASGVWIEGDNPAESTDSRTFGPVPRTLVLGRARYRYAPAARAGAL